MEERDLASITIVAPCYNEAQGIQNFYTTLKAELTKLNLSHDIILVDDGSQDDTLCVLQEIAARDAQVMVLPLSRNFGHQIALTAGLDHAQGDVVITMDSDLQHPPALIPQMLAWYRQGADVVYAVRNQAVQISFLKRITSNGYYALLARMANVQVVRGAADFRLMSNEVVTALRQMRERHRYLRGMIPWLGFNSATLHFDQPERAAGKPTYTWKKSFTLARHGMFSFSTIPLDIITMLGVGVTIIGFLYLAWVLFVWILGIAIPGWTSVIVVLLIMGGIQLISVGVLAQYVGMIFEQSKDRPLYLIKNAKIKDAKTQETPKETDEP